MVLDVIPGARYYDPVFDAEYVVVAVEATETPVMDEEDIIVHCLYEHLDEPVKVSLAQIRREVGHEIVEIPEDIADR